MGGGPGWILEASRRRSSGRCIHEVEGGGGGVVHVEHVVDMEEVRDVDEEPTGGRRSGRCRRGRCSGGGRGAVLESDVLCEELLLLLL